jgi:hypothetical protein
MFGVVFPRPFSVRLRAAFACTSVWTSTALYRQLALSDTLKGRIHADATVLELSYSRIPRSNGKLEAEGWRFSSMFFPHYNGERQRDTILHRVGEWHFYRKNGSLARIDVLQFPDTSVEETRYLDKKGRHFMTKRTRTNENRNKVTTKENYGTSFPLRFFVIRYYRNGKIKYSQQQDGLKTIGEYLEYYATGVIKHKWNYDDRGKLHGHAVDYYSTGLVQRERNFNHGRRIGEFIKYRDDGSVRKTRSFGQE